MKWEPGEVREIADEEPLSNEEMARLDIQRAKGQAALISRAASLGMTPMEMFASGQVVANLPADALAFDRGRQLPAAAEKRDIEAPPTDAPADEGVAGPVVKVPVQANQSLGRAIQDWLEKDRGQSFMEGFVGYFDSDVYTSQAPEDEAVPQTDDSEVVEGEIVGGPGHLLPADSFGEILDGEVIETDPDHEGR